ncbi:hypothetical protein [Thermococcus sp. PK]|uniref:hypothetical protein n=1 Tax=Thermococcus sp. PK TaxID=913025 RepID=UPI0012EC32B8|nr:hypothetical protein [Thermococcus sp. PK]
MVEKGYRPIVKKTKNAPGGFGSKKRDRVFLKKSIGIGILMRGSGVRLQRGLAVGSPVF